MKPLILLALWAAATPTLAQYRCVAADGKVAFQTAPCPDGAKASKLELPAPGPDDGRGKYRAAAAQGKTIWGMNRAEVRLAYGAPTKVNSSRSAGRVFEQWVYYDGHLPYLYLYFEDDALVSTGESEQRR